MRRPEFVIALALAGCLSLAGTPGGFVVAPDWARLPADWTLGDVAGVAVDSHDHVFVFHRGAEHSIFALEGESGRVVTSFGDGLFRRAHGLAVDASDNVWVTDVKRHQVFKFSHAGELQMTLGEEGVPGNDGGHFDQPTDVAIGRDGSIFVSDGYGNSRVAKFSPEGRFLKDWGEREEGPGKMNLPHGIALDREDNVYVADRSNRRVQVYNSEGAYLFALGESVLGRGGRPWGLEIAGERLYVIDGGDMDADTPNVARITVVDASRHAVASFGSYGLEPGQLLWGHDLAVGADGSVYSAEVRDADRVQKFRPVPAPER